MRVVSGNVWFLLVVRIILLSFLVWWFGFGARNPVDSDPLSMFYWSTLFVVMLFIGHTIQNRNSKIGGESSVGTRSFSAISILLLDWSMVSCMRMLDEGAIASTLFEELAMFIFVIAIILWSRTSKTPTQNNFYRSVNWLLLCCTICGLNITIVYSDRSQHFRSVRYWSRADIYRDPYPRVSPVNKSREVIELWFNPIH